VLICNNCWRSSKYCSTRAQASTCKLNTSTRLWINPRKQELIQKPRNNTAIYSLLSHSNYNILCVQMLPLL
jgi:hypothetical protein